MSAAVRDSVSAPRKLWSLRSRGQGVGVGWPTRSWLANPGSSLGRWRLHAESLFSGTLFTPTGVSELEQAKVLCKDRGQNQESPRHCEEQKSQQSLTAINREDNLQNSGMRQGTTQSSPARSAYVESSKRTCPTAASRAAVSSTSPHREGERSDAKASCGSRLGQTPVNCEGCSDTGGRER